MSPRIVQLFLALHVFGVVLWIGGLLSISLLLGAIANESDAGARARLAAFTRKRAMLADIGATIAILFGLHWLFKFKLYAMPYMHIKLTLVVFLIGLHGFLRVKTKRAAEGTGTPVPAFARPALLALALGIIVVVILKVPS